MIELRKSNLVFTFPEIHPGARLTITFMRTLRIPDDGTEYPLPPGLGEFPLEHVDDYRQRLPESWLERGGVMFPMYQSEAMWIDFDSPFLDDHDTEYPFAVKIATGTINALTGERWTNSLSRDPQDYLVIPDQPWLDGYCVEEGIIRQFVAMPLGEGYTVEGQVSGKEDMGGIQIIAYPMKKEAFERRWPRQPPRECDIQFLTAAPSSLQVQESMGLAPGGRMRQEVYTDEYGFSEWDQTTSSRCFVHIANSQVWRSITGKNPPTTAPTAREYSQRGLPWFDYYADHKPLPGSNVLGALKSVVQHGQGKGQNPLPENESTGTDTIIQIRKDASPDQVREWSGGSD